MLSSIWQQEFLRSFLHGIMKRCDKGTWEHSIRVGKLCHLIAQELDFRKPEISYITLAGLLHDVGKVFMTETINYPGKLADKDRYMITCHPKFGVRFIGISFSDLPAQVAEGVAMHHERLNGTGYPNSLQGDEISLTARIVAAADVFDAMNTIRPYRPPLPKNDIYRELNKSGYDRSIVLALVKALYRTKQF